jgi:prophage regulatory protein
MQIDPNVSIAAPALLRIHQVEERVGLRRSSIYEYIKRGEFPAPLKLSRRYVCWPETAIDKWINDRIAASQAPHA